VKSTKLFSPKQLSFLRRQESSPCKHHTLFLISLFILSIFSSVSALQIPLVITWDSSNNASYTEVQTDKEMSWNEYYRIGIAVDSLVYKQAELRFHAQNRANFLKNYIELKDIQFTYRMDNWSASASSKPIGYGLRETLNPYHLISPAKDDYMFQASRFNGLGLAYSKGETTVGISLGGNVQNQSITSLDAAWENPDHSLQLSFTQETRAMDTFWRTPVSISAASVNWNTKSVQLHSELALSYYPKHGLTNEHFSTLSQLELGIKPTLRSFIYVNAESMQLEPKQNALQHFQTSFSYDIASFSLTPGFTLDTYDKQSTHSYHFLAEWRMAKSQRLGIFYRLEQNSIIKSRHLFGLQAELSYGI